MILPVRSVHNYSSDQPERVDRSMPLAAGDLFVSVKATLLASLGHANRLAVDDDLAGGQLLAGLLTDAAATGLVPSLQQAISPPAPKIVHTAFHLGQSCGNGHHWRPLRTTYKLTATTHRRRPLAARGSRPRITCRCLSAKLLEYPLHIITAPSSVT